MPDKDLVCRAKGGDRDTTASKVHNYISRSRIKVRQERIRAYVTGYFQKRRESGLAKRMVLGAEGHSLAWPDVLLAVKTFKERYRQHLGLMLIQTFHDRGSQIAVMHFPHTHAVALLLIETSDYKPLEIMRNGAAFPIVSLNCPDIEYTYRFLENNGVQVGELKTLGNGEAKYFYFRDNEGNLLEGAWSIWDPLDDRKMPFKGNGLR